MRLRYTRRGAAELAAILAHIAAASPQGARRVQKRIQAITTLLTQRPHAGQIAGRGHLRRMVASPYPYLVFYQVREEEIVIHGVRHAARRPLA